MATPQFASDSYLLERLTLDHRAATQVGRKIYGLKDYNSLLEWYLHAPYDMQLIALCCV